MFYAKKRLLVLLVCLVLSSLVKGQAVRITSLCYTSDFKIKIDEDNATNFLSNWFVGMGYEHNVGDRLSVSIDLNTSLGGIFGKEEELSKYASYYDNYYQQQSSFEFYYTSYLSYTEISYQSKYFFESNDDNSWFVSSGIALKFTKWVFNPLDNYYSIPVGLESAFPSKEIIEKKLIVPISLRLGHRGSLDGVYGEYFFGISRNIGAGNVPDDKQLSGFFGKKPMRDIAITAGYLFGIGWAD